MTTERSINPADRARSSRVLSALVRVAWGRRLECGLTLVALAARVTLTRLIGSRLATLALALVAVALVSHGPTRRWVAGFAGRERSQRIVSRALSTSGALGGRDAIIDATSAVPAGQQLSLWVPVGTTVAELEKGQDLLAVAFGARSVRVVRDPAHAAHAWVTIAYHDTLAGEGLAWPWQEAGWTDFWLPFPIGYDEDGMGVSLDLPGHHLLIGGEPGAGKSNALSIVTATAALDPRCDLWLFDGKLVELSAWRKAATCFVGENISEATEALNILRSEMKKRYEWLEKTDKRGVEPGMGLAPIVVVVDELALYLHGTGKEGQGFAEALRDLVVRGRAAGVVVVAATQKPAADVVPTSIRDNFGYRLAMRCATRDASDTVLGAGWATAGYSASDIDPATRGVGLLLADGGIPRRIRAFHLDDAALSELATRAAQLRAERGAR